MLQSADSNRKHSAERQVRMDLRDIVLVVFDVTGARRAASHRHDSILILLAVVVMALPAYGQQLELPTTAAVDGVPICKTIDGLVRYIGDMREWGYQVERLKSLSPDQRENYESSHDALIGPAPEAYGCIVVPKNTPAKYHWGGGVIVVTVAQSGGGIYKGVSRGYLWNNIAP